MRGARNLFLIGVACLGLAASAASAQFLFNLPLSLPGSSPPPSPQTFLPPDADPNYSTPGGYDNAVDMARTTAMCSMSFAVPGINSPILTPGTVVAIGSISPRTCAGASGLGSHVECCGGPPMRKRMMQDFLVRESASEA